MTTLRRLLGYFRPYLGQMLVAALLLALSGALMGAAVATSKPLGQLLKGESLDLEAAGPDILKEVLARLPVEGWTEWLKDRVYVAVPLLLIAIFLIRGVLVYVGQYMVTRVGARIIIDLRTALYESVVRQSQRFFLGHPTGLIMSRILSDVGRVKNVSTNVLSDAVRVGVQMPFLLAVAFVYSWRLSLFTMVGLPLLAYPMVRLGKRLRRAATQSQESTADVASLLNETIVGSRVVQSFTMERFEIDRFRRALSRLLRADLKAGRASALAPAVTELLGAILGAVLFYFAGSEIARGTLDTGDFLAVFGSLTVVFMSARRLNSVNMQFQQALAAATRVFAMLDAEREIRDAPDATKLPPFEGQIHFDQVDFAYEDQKVLRGIDLALKKGEVVALVGASGSGKTTMANLVPRFFDVTAGRVTVDGQDLRGVTLESLRSQIGLVTQETVLFDDTVRNNIAYGRSDIPLERIEESARAAHAHEFVREMPEGYDTAIGERGTRLSMGQRQRIAIARALLKDPPILILDEATSALDAESEALVQQALDVLMKGRTSIVIAHRLATVRRVDRIVVLESGRIVETGTHRELLERGGVYARLHELQFQES